MRPGLELQEEPPLGRHRPLTVLPWPQGEENFLPACALSSGLLPASLQGAQWELPGVCPACCRRWGWDAAGLAQIAALPRMWAFCEDLEWAGEPLSVL